jgi:hypothetical protein
MPKGRALSTVRGPFLFHWPRPIDGEIRLVTEPTESQAWSGNRVEHGQEVISGIPVPEEHQHGPWIQTHHPLFGGEYAPLSIPNMHRRFARLRGTDRSILRFANRYGLLGHGAVAMGTRVLQRYEALRVWRREASVMKKLVEIWDLVKKGDAGKLGQWVRWDINPKRVVLWAEGDFQVLGHERHPDTLPIREQWQFGEVIEPARHYIYLQVSKKLEAHVNPVVHPDLRGDIMLVPDCLLSAMYVQFAIELSGKERPAIVCQGCGRYFPPLHGAQRYCEEECRKRTWWRQKRSNKNTKRERVHERLSSPKV